MSSLLYELLEDHVHDFASIFVDCGLQTVRYGSNVRAGFCKASHASVMPKLGAM